jgi:hypothetical protein
VDEYRGTVTNDINIGLDPLDTSFHSRPES